MTCLDYLNKNFPMRKTDEEKLNFRQYIRERLEEKGIEVSVELTKDGKNNNIVIDNSNEIEKIKYISDNVSDVIFKIFNTKSALYFIGILL